MVRMDRRGFLRRGAVVPGSLLLAPAASWTNAAPQTNGEGKSDDGRKLFLFVDWHHVNKGELEVVLDPDKISENGKKLLTQYAHDFNKHFAQGTEGRRSVNIPYGIRITQEVATRSKPWLVADKPWEKGVSGVNVIREEGRYRCWYTADLKEAKTEMTFSEGRGMELSGSALAYAESDDGWNWKKPALKVLSFRGGMDGNLLTPYCNGGTVWRDPHGLPEERYKNFHFDKLPDTEMSKSTPTLSQYGLYGVTSPDGYRWTKHSKPLVRYFCDTFNIAAWDEVLGSYVGYFRYRANGGRAISRAETSDFWNWPDPTVLLSSDPLDAPADDYYTNGYTHYPDDPSLRLLFVAIYHRNTDLVDVRAALSRDGKVYQWLSYEPIITVGKSGEWDQGSLYANPALMHLPDGRLALPYIAYGETHNEAWYATFYKEYQSNTGIAWALWEDGRLAGIEAADVGGFTTTDAHFQGTQIQINARTTRAGRVEVELREHGNALDGFSFAECIPFNGDSVWAACKWKGKADLAGLKGKRLTLAVRLSSAKIFGYRFA